MSGTSSESFSLLTRGDAQTAVMSTQQHDATRAQPNGNCELRSTA
eukprot:CAMPEP_0206124276 /NCGR_PEP_ID=MMETSP1472-20131121/10964_1 /ASSEMBLY_ACC=CAM_ASM_001108 /TAXON_ID=41880 /ORGANISM="Pycnococcus provasolii, Strain RCC251" /LENGTH=44 /DNA_ID= /DNA_START= /DNA_END= /DNA_ORIENTATION=